VHDADASSSLQAETTPPVSNVPTSDALGMATQSAPSYAPPGLPPDHPAGTKIQRDSWMLNDPKAGTGLDAHQARYGGTFEVGTMPTIGDVTRIVGENYTDDYGEGDVGGNRAGGGTFGGSIGSSGGGDFFSSLGQERKRKEREEKPDPVHVGFSFQSKFSFICSPGDTTDENGAQRDQQRNLRCRRA
jgi:hypothetical protein